MLFLLGLFGQAVARGHIDLDLRTRPRFRAEATVVALTLGVGVAVILVTNSAYAPRYASVFFPLVVLVAAGGLTCFVVATGPRRGVRRPPRPVPAGGLLERHLPAVAGPGGHQRRQRRRLARRPGDLLPRSARTRLQPLAAQRRGGSRLPDPGLARAGRLGRLRRPQPGRRSGRHQRRGAAAGGRPPHLPGVAGRLPHVRGAVRGGLQRAGRGAAGQRDARDLRRRSRTSSRRRSPCSRPRHEADAGA